MFTAPDTGDVDSLLVFELAVEDSQGLMGTDTCQVTVAPKEPALDDTGCPDRHHRRSA